MLYTLYCILYVLYPPPKGVLYTLDAIVCTSVGWLQQLPPTTLLPTIHVTTQCELNRDHKVNPIQCEISKNNSQCNNSTFVNPHVDRYFANVE